MGWIHEIPRWLAAIVVMTTFAASALAGLVSELTTWEGAGHVPYVAHRTEIIDQSTNFLWWTLGLSLASA